MSLGLRAKRGMINALRRMGPDSRATHASVKAVCRRRGVTCTFPDGAVSLVKGTREIRLPGAHTLFAPYVADNFDVFAASVTPEMQNGLAVVDFTRPRVHHYTSLDADFEMPAFPEAIAFDDEYFKYGTPSEGDLVFDLGANIGLVAFALAQRVGTSGRVISFEPDPRSLVFLQRNVDRHGFHQVTVDPVAVAPEGGRLEFYAEGTITSGLASARQEAIMTQSMGSVITVDAITLSDAVERHGVPSWIKMDIEGAEIDVIARARELLATSHPHMVIDTSHWVGGATTAARVEVLLREIGYTVVTEAPGGSQLTWAWHGERPTIQGR